MMNFHYLLLSSNIVSCVLTSLIVITAWSYQQKTRSQDLSASRALLQTNCCPCESSSAPFLCGNFTDDLLEGDIEMDYKSIAFAYGAEVATCLGLVPDDSIHLAGVTKQDLWTNDLDPCTEMYKIKVSVC